MRVRELQFAAIVLLGAVVSGLDGPTALCQERPSADQASALLGQPIPNLTGVAVRVYLAVSYEEGHLISGEEDTPFMEIGRDAAQCKEIQRRLAKCHILRDMVGPNLGNSLLPDRFRYTAFHNGWLCVDVFAPDLFRTLLFGHGVLLYQGGPLGAGYYVADDGNMEEYLLRCFANEWEAGHVSVCRAEAVWEPDPELKKSRDPTDIVRFVGLAPPAVRLLPFEWELFELLEWRKYPQHWKRPAPEQNAIAKAVTAKLTAFNQVLLDTFPASRQVMYKPITEDKARPDRTRYFRKLAELEKAWAVFSEKWDEEHPSPVPLTPPPAAKTDTPTPDPATAPPPDANKTKPATPAPPPAPPVAVPVKP